MKNEIKTTAHLYPVVFEYAGQDVALVEVALNDGEPIPNELIYGSIKGLKIDRENQETIAGALFGLFRPDALQFTLDTAILTDTSDEDGVFSFENIPLGNWIVGELQPAERYLSNTDIHHVQVERNEQLNCGNEMVRRHDSRFKKCQQRWICSNAECHTVIHKADSDLLNDITALLNRVIVNPELVQIPAEPAHEPSALVRKTENEIARTLDTLDYDKDVLRKKMMECVSLKYADIDSAPYTAHRLKALLAVAEPLSAFSLPLFKRTVQAIHLEKDGTVNIKLVNGQMAGKDDENATGDGNAEESGTEDTCQGRYR